jgi:aspartyl-tRNA(Asn)/glutamyl-tRNA(Gln) amidotransferase subunit B
MSAMSRIVSSRLIIGMEIHVELATRTKMFSRAANVAHHEHFDAPPNSLVDPVVCALPGALPVMNRAAVEMAIMVGLALDCTIARFSKWDRKNYFYPDLPKGYQISQYDLPLCLGGAVEIAGPDGSMKRIGIIRAHLEEDTGKLGHELPGGFHYDGSLVDLNRAGTPLLEVVTRPDLESADDAVTFGKELRNICRFLGVTEGIMQRGHMRFEPNVNVEITIDDGRVVRTPIVEIKNLNSFKAVRSAVEHEHRRQVDQWLVTGIEQAPGTKSTRGWDDLRNATVLQREKEEAHDYRYFPEPDLLPVTVSDAWRDTIAARLPELPMRRRARYQAEYGLPARDAVALTDDRDLCFFYEAAIDALLHQAAPCDGHSAGDHAPADRPPADREATGFAVAKLLLNTGARHANERACGIHELGISPKQVAGIIALRRDEAIGSNAADELFQLLCEPASRGADAAAVAQARGMIQVRDAGALDRWIDEAIAAQPQAARDFAAGKDAAAGRIVGHVMKASRGQADASAIQARLRQRLRT